MSLILANATGVAYVLIRSSRFNFHCYTQSEATSTQNWARKWHQGLFATSCAKDYEGHSLVQTTFIALPIRTCRKILRRPFGPRTNYLRICHTMRLCRAAKSKNRKHRVASTIEGTLGDTHTHTHTHTRTHARTHARTRTRTHTHTNTR